ncbi:hypothetical protein [Sandaracinus amylolyticus]|uniref:hypothetical protein n=1 Tax=Sandaracinus amylolyticus TaxID=927083 RepID=UPI001F47388A|nr:hypothetical protein [Sandaracinus amylolyticus]
MQSFTSIALTTLLVALTVGCGDDDVPLVIDAGSLDAGTDAGTPPVDAGEPDAGPPSPIEMARDDARMQVAEATEAFGMIPAASRESAELLAVDLTFVRLDAVIGEKSTSLIDLVGVIGEKRLIRPASLPINAIPAIVVARQLARVVRDIDDQLANAAWAASTEPLRMALRTRLTEARDSLAALRDLVWDRYREIVDSVPITTYPEDTEYEDAMVVMVPPGGIDMHAIVEGRQVTAAEANISVDCGRAVFVTVFDEERGGTQIVGREMVMLGGITVPLPAETPSSIRIAVEDSVSDGNWTQCTFQVFGHRHWRGDAIELDDGENTTLDTLTNDWRMHNAMLQGALEAIIASGGAGEREAATAVRAFIAEMSGDTGTWRGPIGALHEDDYEIHDLLFTRVIDVVGAHLETSPALTSSGVFDTVRSDLAALRMTEDTARQTLAPTHMSGL